MRKNSCLAGTKDCEDLCYRTVSRTGLEWGVEDDPTTEFCPVKNVIMKQPENCNGDVKAHGDTAYTGSVSNGEIAMIYQDACVDGTCSVYVWRN